MDSFKELYLRAGIKEDQTLSFFLSGLVDLLQMPVKMFQPKTLTETYALTKLKEITVIIIKEQPKPITRTPQVPWQPRLANPLPTNGNLLTKPYMSIGLLPTLSVPKIQ